MKQGESVQTCELQPWISEDEYGQVEVAEFSEIDAIIEKQAQFGRRTAIKASP